jgi:glyoxylase-like metal-dependent hydrolase (beta-lactamase superfamily II)
MHCCPFRWASPGGVAIITTISALTGCSRATAPLVVPKQSVVALTGGPNTSMVYLARTANGVIAIDLGWWGSKRAVARALRQLDAAPSEVTDVFLTHSHRDHIGSWRLVRRSRFHVADAERPLLFGDRRHGGWIPRLAERIKPSGLPRPNEIDVQTFSGDTMFVVARDTLYAFLVPGHTAGSTVYLFRGVLFVGDAATHTPWGGFGPARRGYSDDRALGAASLAALWRRLPAGAVRYVCTAHARCRSYSEDFLRDVAR